MTFSLKMNSCLIFLQEKLISNNTKNWTFVRGCPLQFWRGRGWGEKRGQDWGGPWNPNLEKRVWGHIPGAPSGDTAMWQQDKLKGLCGLELRFLGTERTLYHHKILPSPFSGCQPCKHVAKEVSHSSHIVFGWTDKWIDGCHDQTNEERNSEMNSILLSARQSHPFRINILLAKNSQQSCSQLISPHCTQMLPSSPETSTAYYIKSG